MTARSHTRSRRREVRRARIRTLRYHQRRGTEPQPRKRRDDDTERDDR